MPDPTPGRPASAPNGSARNEQQSNPHRARGRSRFRRALLAFTLLALLSGAFAQACLEEIEPNDTPVNATPVPSGQCMTGVFASSDQEMLKWTVSEEDSLRPWIIELEGLDKQLTKLEIYRISFTDDGQGVTAAKAIFELRSLSNTPVSSAPLLLPPGDYYLGLSKSGGTGRWVVDLQPQRVLTYRRTSMQSEHAASGEVALTGNIAGVASVEWTIAEEDAGHRWSIELLTAFAHPVDLELTGPSGSLTSARTGMYGVARLTDLGLTPGSYTLTLRGEGNGQPFALDTRKRGLIIDGHEVEPNNTRETANLLTLGQELKATSGDADWFAFEVTEEDAQHAWNLKIETSTMLNVTLHDAAGETLFLRQRVTGDINTLVLAPGSYALTVSAREAVPYTLLLERAPLPEEGSEREPNDTPASATPLPESLTVRGTFDGRDVDVYRFETSGEAQLWRVQAIGEGVSRLSYITEGGATEHEASGDGRIRLDNFVLLPGVHYLRVDGTGSDYGLKALALGPAPAPARPTAEAETVDTQPSLVPEATVATPELEEEMGDPPAAFAAYYTLGEPPAGILEREPNDDRSRATRLLYGETMVGTLSDPNDEDYYRFYAAADQYIKIEIVPPEGSYLNARLSELGRLNPDDDGQFSIELLVPAGDHYLRVWAADWAAGYYQLRVTRLNPLDRPVDAEPNDSRAQAVLLPHSLTWEGRVGERSDYDYYLLPRVHEDTELLLEFKTLSGNPDFRFDSTADARPTAVSVKDQEELYTALLPGGEDVWLVVLREGHYAVGLGFGEGASVGEGTHLVDASMLRADPASGVEVKVELPAYEVAAYHALGQTLRGEVIIENPGGMQGEVALSGATTDANIAVELPESVQLAPTGTTRVPIEVTVYPDQRDDQPLKLSVALDSGTTYAAGEAAFLATCQAPLVAPSLMWVTPQPLLGHMNVLLTPFGAEVVEPADPPRRLLQLFDGRAAPSTGNSFSEGDSVTVKLPGSEPMLLTGAMLNPQSSSGALNQLRDFELALSLDGESFSTVLKGTLSSSPTEQSFVFAEPVRARYARLTTLSNNEGSTRTMGLGEWKLIAADEALFGPHNLADPALGGHVAWSEPLLADYGSALLDAESQHRTLRLSEGDPVEWVFGFHHSRAAQVSRLELTYDSEQEGHKLERLSVLVSMEGAAGPWTEVAEWELSTDATGTAVLELNAPVWARYLRLSGEGPTESYQLVFPRQVRIYERPPGDGYLSILGEWDHNRKEAAYEWLEQAGPVIESAPAGNDSKERAMLLSSGAPVSGSVLVGEREAWFEIKVPEGDNHLSLRLQGDPSIAYAYELTDAEGERVLYDVSGRGVEITLSAFVEPGNYFLALAEPRHSVVFTWDNSGSMGSFVDILYGALAQFALDLDPTREVAQLVAFSTPPRWVSRYWLEDPEQVVRLINRYDRTDNSSDSEPALIEASEALGQREGTRAIIHMTDAETFGYNDTVELWDVLTEVRPRIFTLETSSAGSDWTQDLMQDWASVNNGYYTQAHDTGELEIGFARAACHLRRAKAYTVTFESSKAQPPGPGSLNVELAPDAPRPAVHVIFDASGSMGARLPNGESRIEVAKRVLNELISDVLAEGTPFSLRAFGHVTPASCEMALEVPLQPLDGEQAARAVAGMEPKLLSKTPIAEALLQVPTDLAEAAPGSIVILITDGEESCGGDPLAAISELRSQGYAVRLAVVSLGLDDEGEVRALTQLAEHAGGTYVDADDAESLHDSVIAALNSPFEVLSRGEVVGSGLVGGDPLELEAGIYTVRVGQEVHEVRVFGDSSLTLQVRTP